MHAYYFSLPFEWLTVSCSKPGRSFDEQFKTVWNFVE